MNPHNVFLVYHLSLHPDTGLNHRLAGKIWLDDGKFGILEDHDLPPELATASPESGATILHNLATSQYSRVVCLEQVLQGHYPDLLEQLDQDSTGLTGEQQDQVKQAEFEYHRTGHPAPQRLIVDANGGAFLDGHALEPDEVQRIQQHVQTRAAVLRPLHKSEGSLADPDAHEAHEHPGFGSGYSHRQWLTTNPSGAHVVINAHATHDIAHRYGDLVATKAVQSVGRAIQKAAQEAGGAKLFHTSGDQFVAHLPTPEHAMSFARALRARLAQTPALKGTHQLSVAMGAGPTHAHAHQAHLRARVQRSLHTAIPGQSDSHAAFDFVGY